MLVNRARRRKKFLQLAIWEVFTEGKVVHIYVHVDKHHLLQVLQQLYSVSVHFQQFEGNISSIKEDLTESFHLERRRI